MIEMFKEAEQYKNRLTIALKAAKICVFEVDLSQQLYTFFENAEDIFGVAGDAILRDVQSFSKLSPSEYKLAVSNYFTHPDDGSIIDEAFACIFNGQSTTYEARMKAGGSKFIWCKVDVTPIVENDRAIKMIGVITDITHIKEKTDALKEKAKLDCFTGLYNKEYTIETIENILKHKKNQPCALILLDIDDFKKFNDNYGHYNGDLVIKQTSCLIKNTFRKGDVIGRFGGDEFLIFLHNFADCEWIAERLELLVQCQTNEMRSTNSIGVSLYPQDAEKYEELFQTADQALYCSKKYKKSYTFFSDVKTMLKTPLSQNF